MNKRIFIYLKNQEQLPLVSPMVSKNPEYIYGIIIENTTLDDFLRTPIGKLNNIQFVEIENMNIASLSSYGAFISTDTSMNNGSNILMILLNIFSAINIPIFELQERLFPLPNKNFSFATHHLNWYDNIHKNTTIIGYPISASKQYVSDGEYILVITDLYRDCYTAQDINNFFSAIYEYARKHTGAAIIWKMSDKEIFNAEIARVHKNYNAFYTEELRKICLCHEHTILSRLSIAELIAKAATIITTTTMPRLLDCELFGKSVAIYSNTTDMNKASIKASSVFHNAEELEQEIFDEPCKKIYTGLLHTYDNNAFKVAIDNHYKSDNILSPRKYVESLLLSSCILEKGETTTNSKSNIPNIQAPVSEIWKRKNRKHLKAIRKMALGLGIELMIIIVLLILLLFI